MNDHPRLLPIDSPKDDKKQEARRLIRWAIEEYDQVAVDSPRDLDRRLRAALGYVGVINISPAMKDFTSDEVDEVNRRLAAELPKLLAAFPNSSDCQWNSAIIYREWGNSLFHYDAYLPVAEHAFGEAEEILEKLSLSDPKRPRLWLQLADTYSVLCEIRWRSAKLQDAGTAFRQCMEILDQHAAEIAVDSEAPVGIFVSCIRLAYFLAGTDREEEAAEFVRRAVHATQRLTTPIQSAAALWLLAPVQLRVGDEAGYRATCQALVDVPDVGIDDNTKALAILTWCLAPNALDDRTLPLKHAEELAANNSVDQPHIVPYALGAALYRAGQNDRAAEQLEKSIAAYPSHPRFGFETINSQRLLLAMSKWKLGQRDEARRLLAETQPAIDQEFQTPSVFYTVKTALEVFRREAESLIEPNEADKAVENESGHRDESSSGVEE
jgi:tetratricopeptide (TPR) repeat protein